MLSFFSDIRYGFRSLRNSPGFTAVATLSLALGIGANTAIFSFINAALLKPLAVDEPGRLVSLYQGKTGDSTHFEALSYPEFEYYRTESRSFSGMLAYLRFPMSVRLQSGTEPVSGELVSPDYFRVLGIDAAAGRLLGPGDADQTAVVVSEAFWRRKLGGEKNAIGRTLGVGSGVFTIVGVVPASFGGVAMDWAEPPAVWIPVASYRAAAPIFDFDVVHEWGMMSYPVSARLRPGVSIEQAQAEVASLAAHLRQAHQERPAMEDEARLTAVLLPVQRFWPTYRGSILTFLGTLMTAVGIVLVVACFNLANMLLARASRREREIAVRLALGAGRGRIARQLLTESVLISILGGAASLLVATWTAQFLSQFRRPFGIPLAVDTSLDWRVLLFSFGVALVTGIAAGLAPALQASRRALSASMKSGTTGSFGRFSLRNALVIGQVALSLLLVSGAGLFVRTLQNARAQEKTLRSEDVALFHLDLASGGYKHQKAVEFSARVLESVRGVPGVRAAGIVWIVPWVGWRGGTDVSAGALHDTQSDFNMISPGYLETVGMPVLRGRSFRERDATEHVALVNEAFARKFWRDGEALGRHIDRKDWGSFEVVGIVRDGKFRGFREDIHACFYIPLRPEMLKQATLEVRAAGNVAGVLAATRARLRDLDPNLPVETRTLRALIDTSLSQERLMASLVSGLGALALTLAAIGIYGVISFTVARRTREIGIRVALGATSGDVRRMVLGQVLALVVIGIVLGLGCAAAITRLIASMLYGVRASDVWTYAGAIALLAGTAAAAAYIPARRAAGIDPNTALRWE